MRGIIRKGATGSAALEICTICSDALGVIFTVTTGAILVPWLGAVLPWFGTRLLNRLHHDLWLFLALCIWTLTLLICGTDYIFKTDLPTKQRIKELSEVLIGAALLLAVAYFILKSVFQIQITLGFISTQQVGAFPALILYVSQPDRLFGLIWLSYYAVAHLAFLAHSKPSDRIAHLPLAHPVAEGPREQYVLQCYQHLEDALRSWDPPLLKLVRWPEFEYYEGPGPLLWKGRTLIISEKLLNPEQTEVFLPALAREIAWYNGPGIWLSQLVSSYPRHGLLFAGLTGNWIWLPALISQNWFRHWQKEQTLDIDGFVHACGQSAWLLHHLRKQRYELQQAGAVDVSWPTLLERIDQLEMLIGKEETQMKNQYIKPASKASATKQLKRKSGVSTDA